MIAEQEIIKALDGGLRLDTSKPFDEISKKLECSEVELIERIKLLKAEGKIKRFGLVVKNRSIGFIYNAMVTLNVPDDEVDRIGETIAKYPFVKLCYQRKRIVPEWNYNLYFMIHGKDRLVVLCKIDELLVANKLDSYDCNVLFSKKCLKQKGAFYF